MECSRNLNYLCSYVDVGGLACLHKVDRIVDEDKRDNRYNDYLGILRLLIIVETRYIVVSDTR
jgi:hypothetical protein